MYYHYENRIYSLDQRIHDLELENVELKNKIFTLEKIEEIIGGGGGGVISAEPYNNIAWFEMREEFLLANTPVTYTFTAPDLGIYEITVVGNESKILVTIRVEALNGTSTLVTVSAPGIVYKNVNIWADTKNITEAIIRFKIENSWFASNNFTNNDIKMVRWGESYWILLETNIITKDSAYTYFESKTGSLSPFAIVGLKVPLPSNNSKTVN